MYIVNDILSALRKNKFGMPLQRLTSVPHCYINFSEIYRVCTNLKTGVNQFQTNMQLIFTSELALPEGMYDPHA